MARTSSPPFRRVGGAEPRLEWFLVRSDGEYRDLPASLNDWDPAASITAAVRVVADRADIETRTGVGTDANLRLNVSWYCRTTQVRGSGDTLDLGQTKSEGVMLTCMAPGDQLGGEVEFRVALVLASPGSTSSGLAATIPGSVLWEATQKVVIEGIGGRFPMVWVDFEASGLPTGAAWYLDWDPHALDDGVLHGARLHLNRSHERLRQAVEDPSTPEGQAILEFLYFDLGRTLITGALRNGDFVEQPDRFQTDTLGDELRRLIGMTFPGVPVSHLADRLKHQPATFERDLQHGLRILGAFQG